MKLILLLLCASAFAQESPLMECWTVLPTRGNAPGTAHRTCITITYL